MPSPSSSPTGLRARCLSGDACRPIGAALITLALCAGAY